MNNDKKKKIFSNFNGTLSSQNKQNRNSFNLGQLQNGAFKEWKIL